MASIFSRIVAGEIPCHKVAEDDHFLAFMDIIMRLIRLLRQYSQRFHYRIRYFFRVRATRVRIAGMFSPTRMPRRREGGASRSDDPVWA